MTAVFRGLQRHTLADKDFIMSLPEDLLPGVPEVTVTDCHSHMACGTGPAPSQVHRAGDSYKMLTLQLQGLDRMWSRFPVANEF